MRQASPFVIPAAGSVRSLAVCLQPVKIIANAREPDSPFVLSVYMFDAIHKRRQFDGELLIARNAAFQL